MSNHPPSTPPRIWFLDLLGRPTTMNHVRKGSGSHWSKQAESTRRWRDLARINQLNAVRAGRAPRSVSAIEVTAVQTSKDRRWLQDLGACFPAAKAGIDGLVDAGLIPDDTHEYVRLLGFRPPIINGTDALRLYIKEVAAG